MKQNRFRPDANYWDQKLSNYLHDPPDKALYIPGHEERSQVLLESLGNLPSPYKEFYQPADQIAAGMDRAQLPGYSPEALRSGAVNFIESPVLTHPTGEDLGVHLLFEKRPDQNQITSELLRIIREDIDGLPEKKGLSDDFRGDPIGFSSARFHYVHHVLRERLAKENVGGLGGVWYRIPADTRIPDHSIWQHCGLVSSLCSCFDLSKERRASLVVFNITPVQDFISRARKLRDFWIGSLILSWLAFEGIREVIYRLGSDHVLYPSLIGQPLINWLLAKECGLKSLETVDFNEVASFPNKFVCLVPAGQEGQLANDIKQTILDAWIQLGTRTLELVERKIARKDIYLSGQFQRQMKTYWEFHWAACPLLDETSQEPISQLLHKDVWQRVFQFIEDSKTLPHETKGEGIFYGITHALAQSFLAAGKTHRTDHRQEEPGIKCNLHGDFEALRFDWKVGEDRNPRPAKDPFWSALKSTWEPRSDFKPSERLSAISLVKRLAYHVCKKWGEHPLSIFFKDAERFPSTTEMALADWLDRVERKGFHEEVGDNWRKSLAQVLHDREKEEAGDRQGIEITEIDREKQAICQKIIKRMDDEQDTVQDDDKYYAILLMDGDHMGRLVNGETLASTWQTVLHSALVSRLRDKEFDQNYRKFWETEMNRARLLAPSVHAAISEALGDFSLYSVPSIVKKHRGRLIYAGGDDLCAVFPASTALQAAREIAKTYSQGFLVIPGGQDTGNPSAVEKTWHPTAERLALHLGKGGEISISAGILFVHHKKPLTVAMREVHQLLNRAKNQGGRNGVAIELEKRSGGGRVFMAGWNERPLSELGLEMADSLLKGILLIDHFLEAARAMGTPGKRSLSVSLVYRLEQLRSGLEAIIKSAPGELVKFVNKQMEKSGKEKNNEIDTLAYRVCALIARKGQRAGSLKIDTDSLIIARFIGARIARVNGNQGGDS